MLLLEHLGCNLILLLVILAACGQICDSPCITFQRQLRDSVRESADRQLLQPCAWNQIKDLGLNKHRITCTKVQIGIQATHCTETALIRVSNDIREALDNNLSSWFSLICPQRSVAL